MFCVAGSDHHGMLRDHFAEIIQDDPGVDFLKNQFLLSTVEVYKPYGIFEFAKTGFLALYELSYNQSNAALKPASPS